MSDYSNTVKQAFRDWGERRAYVDNNRNYRVKREGSSNGPITPWNKEVKRLFANCSEFHVAAVEHAAHAEVR